MRKIIGNKNAEYNKANIADDTAVYVCSGIWK